MLRDLLFGLAIGLLIGVERGWQQRGARAGSRVAGLRTFGLFGLLGALAGSVARVQPLAGAALALAGCALVVIGYRRSLRRDAVSATTLTAALVTIALGLLAALGWPVAALAAAAITAFLLAQRRTLHGWLRGLSEADLQAVVRFAVIAGAVWPLLPDRDIGPYGAWNPRELWLVVVIVCAIGFAGYGLGRRFGPGRGTLVTAAVGALYSSTAVTAALAQRLRAEPAARPLLGAGIALASAVMFGRVSLLCALLVPFALLPLVAVIGPAAGVALLFAGLAGRRAGAAAATPLPKGNPFALLPALGFAMLVALVGLVVRWAELRFGDAGVAVTLAIAGSVDVDAAIVSLRALPAGTIPAGTAGLILALPVLLNTLFKAGVVLVQAGWSAGGRAALPLLAAALAILAGYGWALR